MYAVTPNNSHARSDGVLIAMSVFDLNLCLTLKVTRFCFCFSSDVSFITEVIIALDCQSIRNIIESTLKSHKLNTLVDYQSNRYNQCFIAFASHRMRL